MFVWYMVLHGIIESGKISRFLFITIHGWVLVAFLFNTNHRVIDRETLAGVIYVVDTD